MKKLLLISVLFFTIKASSKESRVLQSPSFGRVGVAKCPIKQGNIIYAFRNLYNYITQEIHEFEDNCDASARGGNGNNYGFIRLKQKPTVSIVSNSSIKIYPNPTIGIINIANKKVSQILVTNSLGKIVYQNKVIASQLNLSHLPNGLYIIRLIANDGKTETDKLIIQH